MQIKPGGIFDRVQKLKAEMGEEAWEAYCKKQEEERREEEAEEQRRYEKEQRAIHEMFRKREIREREEALELAIANFYYVRRRLMEETPGLENLEACAVEIAKMAKFEE